MLSPEGLRAKFAPPSQGERGEAAFFDAIQRMDSAAAVAELYRAALPIEE